MTLSHNDWLLYRPGLYMVSLYGKYKEKEMLSITDYQEDEFLPPVEQIEDYLMTIREVAKFLRVDPTTVRRWITSGALKAVALPSSGKVHTGGYRVWRSEIENVLSGQE